MVYLFVLRKYVVANSFGSLGIFSSVASNDRRQMPTSHGGG